MDLKENKSLNKSKDSNKKPNQKSLKTVAHIVYLLQSLSILLAYIPTVIGAILNYTLLSKTKGTWLESHFRWQIKNFWLTAIFFFLGSFLLVIGYIISNKYTIYTGSIITTVITIWLICRITKGWISLCKNKEVKKKNH